jgi:ATP-dependent Clp protease ATP-binding subunit ClpC
MQRLKRVYLMPNKMQRFTADARRVLSYAQGEANYLQSSFIGTEHLLVALVREEVGIAGRVLRAMGASKQPLQALLEQLAGEITPRMSSTPPELSPGVKRVLELAVVEARNTGSESVDSGHLLTGLVRLPESTATQILKHLRINPDAVRQRIAEERNPNNGESSA